MKEKIISSIFSILILICSPAMSEIYTWVDNNGKKHFGDSIPKKYQDQGSEYEVSKTNSSQAVKTEKITVYRPSADVYSRDTKSDKNLEDYLPKPKEKSCKELKDEHLMNKSCFAACRSGNNGNVGGACSHCTNTRKPKC